MQENAAEFFGTDLYRIETAADGTVALKHVFHTDSNTTFMVRTGNLTKGFTYTVVKGYENVANYTNATVDYVNLDGDSYADYVYITGDADDASYFGIRFPPKYNVGKGTAHPLQTRGHCFMICLFMIRRIMKKRCTQRRKKLYRPQY